MSHNVTESSLEFHVAGKGQSSETSQQFAQNKVYHLNKPSEMVDVKAKIEFKY